MGNDCKRARGSELHVWTTAIALQFLLVLAVPEGGVHVQFRPARSEIPTFNPATDYLVTFFCWEGLGKPALLFGELINE